MSELTSFLTDVTILLLLACNSITISSLRARINDLEYRVDKLTERGEGDGKYDDIP